MAKKNQQAFKEAKLSFAKRSLKMEVQACTLTSMSVASDIKIT